MCTDTLGKLVKFEVTVDPVSQERAFYATLAGPIPVALRSTAGCIANELRACLDGLAVCLAERNDKGPGRTYFPISKTAEGHKTNGPAKLQDLSAEDRNTILSMETHGEGRPDLFKLHEADRTRKHQRLGAASSTGSSFASSGIVLAGGGMNQMVGCSLEGIFVRHLTYYGKVDLGAAGYGQRNLIVSGAPMGLPVTISVDPVYETPDALQGEKIVPSLRSWCDSVDAIISRFD